MITSYAEIIKVVNRLANVSSVLGRWQTHLIQQTPEERHKDQPVQNHRLWLRVMGRLLVPPKTIQTVPPSLPLHHPKHPLQWRLDEVNEVFKKVKITSNKILLLKSQLCWVGHLSRKRNHHLPRILLCSKLSTGHHNREKPKKQFKNCWIKIP